MVRSLVLASVLLSLVFSAQMANAQSQPERPSGIKGMFSRLKFPFLGRKNRPDDPAAGQAARSNDRQAADAEGNAGRNQGPADPTLRVPQTLSRRRSWADRSAPASGSPGSANPLPTSGSREWSRSRGATPAVEVQRDGNTTTRSQSFAGPNGMTRTLQTERDGDSFTRSQSFTAPNGMTRTQEMERTADGVSRERTLSRPERPVRADGPPAARGGYRADAIPTWSGRTDQPVAPAGAVAPSRFVGGNDLDSVKPATSRPVPSWSSSGSGSAVRPPATFPSSRPAEVPTYRAPRANGPTSLPSNLRPSRSPR